MRLWYDAGMADARRRLRRWPIAMTLLVISAAIVLVRSYDRKLRVERAVKQVEAKHGYVNLGDSVWRRLLSSVRGQRVQETEVSLYSNIDDRWLETHGNLSDLNIECLYIDSTEVSGHQIATLVQHHPIAECMVESAHDADLIASALSNRRRVRSLWLQKSDLTDSGLRQLPLEQLKKLDIGWTYVTAAGLSELQRCRCLEELTVDKRQRGPALNELQKTFPGLSIQILEHPLE